MLNRISVNYHVNLGKRARHILLYSFFELFMLSHRSSQNFIAPTWNYIKKYSRPLDPQMAFQRPPTKSSLAGEVNKFASDVDSLSGASPTDPQAQRNATRLLPDLQKRERQLESRLKSDANADQHQALFARAKETLARIAAEFQARTRGEAKGTDGAAGAAAPAGELQALQRAREEEAHLQFIDQQAGQILDDQKVLKDLTQQVGEIIDRDHEKIVKVEAVTTEALEEMIAGNAELEQAEEHQKACLLL
jgi:hypothetical protein